MEELIAEASRLQAENARVEAQIGAYTTELTKVDGENAVLRARHGELAGRLQALGGVLEIFSGVSGQLMHDDLLLHWGMEERLSSQPWFLGALLVAPLHHRL